jgi:hypothetical protein
MSGSNLKSIMQVKLTLKLINYGNAL